MSTFEVRAVKRVVVIGGGPAGRLTVVNLHKYAKKQKGLKFDVLLVDKREYTENTPSAVRAWVDLNTHDLLLRSLNDVFPQYDSDSFKITTMVGDATRITPNSVHVKHPTEQNTYDEHSRVEEVAFDALVVATGSNYPVFKGSLLRLADRKTELAQWKDRIAAANHVLVVGGGVVGVEIAGEILTIHPQKQITIVHGENSLLNSNNKHTQTLAHKKLTSFPNVKILFGQKVDLQEVRTHGASGVAHEYVTTKGERINADVAVLTAGIMRPNTQMFEQDLPNVLNPQGYIKVLPTLQVEGIENMFAIGDAANRVGKLAANTTPQADLAVKNLISFFGAKKLANAKNGYTSPALVTIGPQYGIMAMVSVFGKSPNGGWVSGMKTKVVFNGLAPKPITWQ